MDTAQLVVTILGAGGGGAAILALINGTFKWLTGAAGRERQRNTDLVAQRLKAVEERETAENERDSSDVKRRDAYEYASQLRRQLIEHGIEPIPPITLEDPYGFPGAIKMKKLDDSDSNKSKSVGKTDNPAVSTNPASPYS